MTTTAPVEDRSEGIGFARLHALVARGYRPSFGMNAGAEGTPSIFLTHPRARRGNPPPPITLWSDGILATTKVLFPERYVPEEGKAPPDWQRYILAAENDRFTTFLASVAPPGWLDLYARPALFGARRFGTRLGVAAALCAVLAVTAKLLLHV